MSLVSLLIILNLNIIIIIVLNFWIIAIIYMYIFQGIYLTSCLIVSYFRREKLHTSLNTCRQKVTKTETVNSSLQTQSLVCNNIMSLQKPLCLIPWSVNPAFCSPAAWPPAQHSHCQHMAQSLKPPWGSPAPRAHLYLCMASEWECECKESARCWTLVAVSWKSNTCSRSKIS